LKSGKTHLLLKEIISLRNISLFLAIFCILALGLLVLNIVDQGKDPKSYVMKGFKTHFAASTSGSNFQNEYLNRQQWFNAYSRYLSLNPGTYQLDFFVSASEPSPGDYQFEVALDKGRAIGYSKSMQINVFPNTVSILLKLTNKKEIEPRIRYVKGNRTILLDKVLIKKVKNYISWQEILLYAILLAVLIFILFQAFIFTQNGKKDWKFFLSLFLLILGFMLILRNAWVSEDAFITLRHVENLLSGGGPVYNLAERVEGFTHTLWFYIITLFRAIGCNIHASVLIPSFIFSFMALFVLFFKVDFTNNGRNGVHLINFSGAILIGMSAFIDFGTSGLESPLSFFLLAVYALFISRDYIRTKSIWMGLIVSLMTLTRPDFGIFFLFICFVYAFGIFRKTTSLKVFLRFLLFPVLLLGGYQIFRMGYYAAFFPNPFYAKSGGGAYFSQGFKYLMDFFQGSLAPLIVLFAVLVLIWSYKSDMITSKKRFMVFFSGVIYGLFVVRGGGDFMHGRFLLPAILLISLSSVGAFESFFNRQRLNRIIALGVTVLLVFASLALKPLQKRGASQYASNHGITDERAFYNGNRVYPLADIFKDHTIIMWKTIGLNYRSLANSTRMKIRTAYGTVGFLGFYAGPFVHIVDQLGLTDAVVSRVKISRRGRPGHEKHAPFAYLIMQKLTFADTPFPLWNRIGKTSYGILWDLSLRTRRRFSSFLPPAFKENLDQHIDHYLSSLTKHTLGSEADFLFFLKTMWSPFASADSRSLFNQVYDEKIIRAHSSYYQWIDKNQVKIEKLKSRIRGKLTFKKFINNVIYTIKHFNQLPFSEPIAPQSQ